MKSTLSVCSIVRATRDHVACSLGDESAILNMKNSVYYGLNPVGTRVWNLVQEPRIVGDIRDTLLDEYEVEAQQCERDLLDLLEKMREQGLIEVREAGERLAG